MLRELVTISSKWRSQMFKPLRIWPFHRDAHKVYAIGFQG